MGQAVLRNHMIDGRERDSVGFWCREGARKGLPTDDGALYASLANAAALRRRGEPGLSLIVPFLLSDIAQEHLIEATIRNYYFPILTGRLVVVIDDTVIDANSFDAVSASLSGSAVPPSVLEFVRQLQQRRSDAPQLVLPPEWQTKGVSGDLLGVSIATELRDRFRAGEMLSLRAPLTLRQKDRSAHESYVDLFLRAARPGERTQTLVVRGAITVPTEGKKINLVDCHAALLATHDPISRLLGDAENPAHTQWNERAERLRAGWQGGGLVLRRVRALLPEIYDLISERIERDDPLALLEFFSIPKGEHIGANRKTHAGTTTRPPLRETQAFQDRETRRRLCRSSRARHSRRPAAAQDQCTLCLRRARRKSVQSLQRVRFQLLRGFAQSSERECAFLAD